jgi:hypothetical protein
MGAPVLTASGVCKRILKQCLSFGISGQGDKRLLMACVGPEAVNVRFGSEADISQCNRHVRFTPNSDRKSGFPHRVMSALHPKADMCGATRHVCFGPIADIAKTTCTIEGPLCTRSPECVQPGISIKRTIFCCRKNSALKGVHEDHQMAAIMIQVRELQPVSTTD